MALFQFTYSDFTSLQTDDPDAYALELELAAAGGTVEPLGVSIDKAGDTIDVNVNGLSSSQVSNVVSNHTGVDPTPVSEDGFHRVVVPIQNRWTMYTDRRWVGFDADQGPNMHNAQESAGTGSTPNVSWQNIGVFVPRGARLDSIKIIARSNNQDISSVESFVRVQHADWYNISSSVDSNGEITAETLSAVQDLRLSQGPGNSADMKGREISLGGFEMPEDGMLLVFLRPTSAPSTNRFLRASMMLDMVVPNA